MKAFRVRYVFTNDASEYACTVRASSADVAETMFRAGLRDEELADVVILSVEECKP